MPSLCPGCLKNEQVARNKIEEYTTSKWKHKWTTAPQSSMTHQIKINPNIYLKWAHSCCGSKV